MTDTFFRRDKAKHLAICMVAGAFPPMLAIGLAIGKEYGDYQRGHWCWLDILADAIGTAIGAVVWWIVWH